VYSPAVHHIQPPANLPMPISHGRRTLISMLYIFVKQSRQLQ